MLAVFGLEPQKNKKDEIWIQSPFTGEQNASLHVHLGQNVYKDFSSGKGGGILNFCQDLLAHKGRVMNCYQVAEWMISEGISSLNKPAVIEPKPTQRQNQANPPVSIDLQPFIEFFHPELENRGISDKACRYLGCGYLPERATGKCSPLNGRLIFQVRGISQDLNPVIISHVGRALTDHQADLDGRYWGFPFSKKLEIYNQDKLLLDPKAREQVERYGLTLVEGFFDVAALVSTDCLNAGALMGAHMAVEQVLRIKFLASHMDIGKINLFLNRDKAGSKGTRAAASMLTHHGFIVNVFDWNRQFSRPGCPPVGIKPEIKDPADMSEIQLKYLRKQGMI